MKVILVDESGTTGEWKQKDEDSRYFILACVEYDIGDEPLLLRQIAAFRKKHKENFHATESPKKVQLAFLEKMAKMPLTISYQIYDKKGLNKRGWHLTFNMLRTLLGASP
jgi:Protein of unknown function (DUF3800)